MASCEHARACCCWLILVQCSIKASHLSPLSLFQEGALRWWHNADPRGSRTLEVVFACQSGVETGEWKGQAQGI